jgi:hypothetical protein
VKVLNYEQAQVYKYRCMDMSCADVFCIMLKKAGLIKHRPRLIEDCLAVADEFKHYQIYDRRYADVKDKS